MTPTAAHRWNTKNRQGISNGNLDTVAEDLGKYLEKQAEKDTLRFITCGSVDDGKSTLIGRLLYESKVIFDDQLAALTSDSQKYGTQDGALDFALLVDGLGRASRV